ncbi:hypothetical protein ACFV2Z_40240 [Streptomyces sp. NPDC059688]|uniref:hypothetical protein n=1 Tax=Streptomyces sp. NPDC059688 TaxID=3346906 RepID=UPI0036C03492
MSSMQVALLGGILVFVVVVVAIVLLGMRALDRARPEDVPTVTAEIMRTMRDGRRALQRRVGSLPPAEPMQAPQEEQPAEPVRVTEREQR